jgi:hypothetical protein
VEPGGVDTVVAEKTARQATQPEKHTDFVYSIVIDRVILLRWAIVVLGPPTLLTAAWLYSRRSPRPEQPT